MTLMLHYNILTTKHYTVSGLFFYLCPELYTHSLILKLQYQISSTKHYTVPLFIRYVLLCVCFITITYTKVTILQIKNKMSYRSLVYSVCSFMCSLYFTHNHKYQCYNITYHQPNILPLPSLGGLFVYAFIAFYT